MINVKSFHIYFNGDPLVGIYSTSWDLVGEFYFEDKKELEEFRQELVKLFELQTGDKCNVLTCKELIKLNNKEI